jgi:GH35 family endo-1,4-beta-xylanase
MAMKVTAKSINPEDYILSVLSPEDRLDAAFKVAKEAFKNSKLTMADIDNAVKTVRRKAYGKKG